MDKRPPRVVADLILSAVPDLRDRLLEHRIRRAWSDVVGADAARRAQPRSFAEGCLTVAVDNSPWLHALTPPPVRCARARLEPPSRVGADAERPAPLDAGVRREIDQAASAIPDPALAAA